jgi:hypothetical protein
MVEQVRRLRRDSQSCPGRPRVIVRANYVGLPSMAGRGTDESGESRRISGRKPCPVPGSTIPRPKIAAVERREARWADRKAHAAPHQRGIVKAPLGAPLPRIISGRQQKRQASRRLTKARAAAAWLFEIVRCNKLCLILRSPSGARASRRMGRGTGACMVRDASHLRAMLLTMRRNIGGCLRFGCLKS